MSEARVWAQPPLRLVRDHGRVTRDTRATYLEPMPPLVLHYAVDGVPVRFAITEEVVNVGAHPGNTIVVDEPAVSSFHCRMLRRVDGALWLRDLGSTNGTWIDGTRVTEAEVQPGSTVRVGGCAIRVDKEVLTGEVPELPGLVARDPVLTPVLGLLQRAAPSAMPLLLLGESGCGKEVAARAVHELSPRAGAPFVPVNCGAIAPELAEAELFGHEKGAFTGAVGSSPGAFGAAGGGTIFLDEIAELPLALQVKLLRALESNEVKPVGASKPRHADVRIVCATHRDLKALVRDGKFREDLYYRIAGLTVTLLPLRSRKLDVLPLAERFLEEVADGIPRTLAADARDALLAHEWPGNVRELRNVIRLAALMSDSPVINRTALRFDRADQDVDLQGRRAETRGLCVAEPIGYGTGPSGPLRADDFVDTRGRTLAEIEAIVIRRSFSRHRGNRRAMMAELGLSKSGLLRKLDALGLRSRDPESEPEY